MTINLTSIPNSVQSLGNLLLRDIVPKVASQAVYSVSQAMGSVSQAIGSVSQAVDSAENSGGACSLDKVRVGRLDSLTSQYSGAIKGIITSLVDIVSKLLGVLSKLLPANFGTANANSNNPASANGSSKLSFGNNLSSGISDQFLWKPRSEKDGKLVVLFPSRLTGSIKGATIVSPDGKVLAQGRDAGFGNGGRHHFRFERTGTDYPAGARLVGQLQDGRKYEVVIKNPGQRTIK